MTAPVAGAAVAGGTLVALDAAYRAALARTSLAVIRAMLAEWSTVSPDDLAGTSERFLARSVELALAGRRNAGQLANQYTSAVRQMQAPDADPFVPLPIEPPTVEQIRESFEYTAIKTTARERAKLQRFVEQQRAAQPVDPSGFDSGGKPERLNDAEIMKAGITRASAAAVRHITTGGMDQLKANVENDAVAVGWYRTTKANCCYFCAMLASRGLVYKEKSFQASNAKFKGSGEQKVHDNCGCGLRPVYTLDDELPERTAEFEQLWADRAAKYSGKEAIYEFRLAYEGRARPRRYAG